MTPTMNLRYVEREQPPIVYFDETGEAVTIHSHYKRLVLQQQWVSPYVGEAPVWRDVPLVDLAGETK